MTDTPHREGPDFFDPATEDWSEITDINVCIDASDGIPEAIAEADRRGLSYGRPPRSADTRIRANGAEGPGRP